MADDFSVAFRQKNISGFHADNALPLFTGIAGTVPLIYKLFNSHQIFSERAMFCLLEVSCQKLTTPITT